MWLGWVSLGQRFLEMAALPQEKPILAAVGERADVLLRELPSGCSTEAERPWRGRWGLG